MRENQLIWAGYALASGWLAAIRMAHAPATVLLRYLAAVAIPFVAALILWGPMKGDQSFGFIVILAGIAIPVVVVAFVFDLLRQLTGSVVYLALLALATASYVATFAAYLKS